MPAEIWTFEHAHITYVVDGDTLDIELDLGFSIRVKHRFRMLGIDTPERGQPGWLEARAHLEQFIGQPICRLEVTKQDKYGRYLVTLFMQPDRSVNVQMLELGLASIYT